jgi:Helicase conserved C-terminal domain
VFIDEVSRLRVHLLFNPSDQPGDAGVRPVAICFRDLLHFPHQGDLGIERSTLIGGRDASVTASSRALVSSTRRYIERKLKAAIIHTDQAGSRVAFFTGEVQSRAKREELKRAFNTAPDQHPLRILIATDAAREGINLQRHCRDLVHFDLPWNPSRLDQRYGPIDRLIH